MFRKFAKADVVDVKFSRERVSSYDGYRKLSDFSFNDYITNDGYLYARVVAIASKVNKNHDGWPAQELQRAYRTFVGKPIFVDHHNHDPKRARGVIVDSEVYSQDQKTSSLDPYYSSEDVDPLHLPATHIELLLEVDAKKFPKLAKAIISRDIDSVSMGADVGHTICSHCGNKAEDPSQFCRHIISKGAFFDYTKPNGQKTSKKSYENCHKVSFFEISWVFDPAEVSALAMDIRQASVTKPDIKSLVHTASMYDEYEDDPTGEFSERAPEEGLSGSAMNQRQDEAALVEENRYRNLIEMGYDPALAREIAKQEYRGPGAGIDTHALRGLIEQGASPEQAYAITAARVAQVRRQRLAAAKKADNDPPQSEMTKMPAQVDTLRQEEVCPICGSDMEDGECQLCGYTEPPEGFNNPDLDKAKDVDQQIHQEQAQQGPEDGQMDQGNQVQPQDVAGSATEFQPIMSKYMPVTIDASDPSAIKVGAVNPKTETRINTQELPLLPINRQNSDRPLAVRTLKSPGTPTESKTKTLANNIKTADGASPHGTGTSADKRVDVEGVGAVTGDPLSGIKSESLEKDTGDFVAPHTMTWSGGEGDSLGQQDAVTSEEFEGGGQGGGNAGGGATSGPPPHNSAARTACDYDDCDDPDCDGDHHKKSSVKESNKYIKKHGDKWVIVQKGTGKVLSTHDSEEKAQASFEAMEAHKHGAEKTAESAGLFDGTDTGSDKAGVSPNSPSAAGFPDHEPARVDLNAGLAEEVAPRTMTWSDGKGDSLGQQEPTTKGESPAGLGGPIGAPATSSKESKSFGFAVKAMKLAETEAAIGTVANKWERLAELEDKSEEYIDAQLEALAKVRTASVRRTAQTRTAATRMPSLRPVTAAERVEVADADTGDSLSW